MKKTPKKGSILYALIQSVKNQPQEAGRIIQLWEKHFGEQSLDEPLGEQEKNRLKVLLKVRAIERDNPKMLGLFENIQRWGIYCGRKPKTVEEKLDLAVDNYRIGKVFLNKMFNGLFYGPYAVTLEPHFGIKKQESLWMLKLSDLELAKDPTLARIGVNFHYESSRPIISVVVVQGQKGQKEALQQFYKKVHQPWPIFMLQQVQFMAERTKTPVIRGLPQEHQPFFHKPEFKSRELVPKEKEQNKREKNRESYSLYNRTFQEMKFKYKGTHFEQKPVTGMYLSEKRRRKISKHFEPRTRIK